MSFNIVDLVKDQISGSLMSQMGSMLGNESSRAAGAVDSAVPALLEGLRNSTSTSSGADSLFHAVQNQDDSMMDNLGSMLSGGQGSQVIDGGNSLLGSLFGSGGLGSLGSAISSVSGLSKGGTGSLMGMVTPIIIGVLKRKVLGNGLNAGGLASLLMGQKDNIGGAMPVGLSDQLGSSGFLSSIGGSLGGAGAMAAGAVAGAGAMAAGAAGSVRDGVSNAGGAVADTAGNVAGGARDMASGAAGRVGDVAGGARDAAGNVAGGVRDAAGNAVDGAGNMAGGVRDAAGNVAGGARDAAGNVAGGARDAAGNVAGGVRDAAGSATGAVGDAAHGATHATTETASSGGGFMKWLLPLLGILLLGWLGLKFFGGTADEQLSESATDVSTTATAAAGDVDVDGVGDELTGFFSGATDTFNGITDADSATAAVPQLEEMGANLGGLNDKLQSVPEAARGPLTDIIGKGTEGLTPIMDKVMGLPGVGDVLTPVVGPIQEMLKGMAG